MRTWFVAVLSVFVLVGVVAAQSDTADLTARVAALERQLGERQAMDTSSAATLAEIPEVGPKAGVGKFGNFDVAVDATGVVQQTLGDSDAIAGGDRADATITLDIRMATQLADDAIAFMLLEAGTGDGLDNEVGTLAGLREEENPNTAVRLSELWYQKSWCNKMVEFTIGKIDLTQMYDWNAAAKTEKTQFLSDALNDNMTVDFPGDTIAAALKVQPVDIFYASIGWGDGNADLDDIFEDSFGIIELGLTPKIMDLQGHYRLYGWINASNHTELTNVTETNETGSGIGLSVDQAVYQDIVVLFGRYGYATEDIYLANQAFSVGLAVNGDTWGRKGDTVAIAYNQAILSDDAENSLETPTTDAEDESLVELYYRWAINRSVELSPVLQYVANPGGLDQDDVWVLGLRAQLWF